MKAIILNASPRKGWNTAQLLKAARQGAEEAGAETEYIDLYDLNFTGCRSCLLCKRKDGERCKCFWKDDLSPLLDRVFAADVLLIGSPIYLGDTTSQFHAFVERLHFCTLSYDDYSNYFTGKVNVGVIFTMNAPQAYYQLQYRKKLSEQANAFRSLNGKVQTLCSFDTLQVKDYSNYFTGKVNVGVIFTMNAPQAYYQLQYRKKLSEQANAFRSLNGKVETLCSFDTLQVKDYGKFNMAGFNAEHKLAHHEKQFPLDLEKARQMGKELVQLSNTK